MALTLSQQQIIALLRQDITYESSQSVTAATNASPAVLTVTGHGYSTGDVVSVQGATANTAINGLRRVVVVDANTFSMTDFVSGAAVAGNGTFAGTVTVYRVKLGLRPGDLDDLQEALSRTSYVGGSDSNRAAEHTVASILGV